MANIRCIYEKDFDHIWNTLSSCAVFLCLIKRTDFTLNDAHKVLRLISVPARRGNLAGRRENELAFQLAFLGVQLTMAMKLTSQRFRELMGPNGDDRTILGRKSNHVIFFFFIHGYFLSTVFSPPSLP